MPQSSEFNLKLGHYQAFRHVHVPMTLRPSVMRLADIRVRVRASGS
jgi:hypothetical protein